MDGNVAIQGHLVEVQYGHASYGCQIFQKAGLMRSRGTKS